MSFLTKHYRKILLTGDLLVLYISLILMLSIRYFGISNNVSIWNLHIEVFSVLFIVSIFSFYVFGLYENYLGLKHALSSRLILKLQILNTLLFVVFFYFIPYFNITPKTNLIIFSFISSCLLIIWRSIILRKLTQKIKINTLIIGQGKIYRKIVSELNINDTNYRLVSNINTELSDFNLNKIEKDIFDLNVKLIILDFKNNDNKFFIKMFYKILNKNIFFMNIDDFYEYHFRKIFLRDNDYVWFVKNVKKQPHFMYDLFKRLFDISVSLVLSIPLLISLPLVFLFSKIIEKDKMFYLDNRVGQNNKLMKIIKFRSMSSVDGKTSKWSNFMRKTRIDELPQIINVLKGELSVFGPRPERLEIIENYNSEIPYYNLRHLIKPGLSGWAQIYHDNHPHGKIDIIETKEKLAYDFYYLKNRSFFLDLRIALKTIRVIIFSKGK